MSRFRDSSDVTLEVRDLLQLDTDAMTEGIRIETAWLDTVPVVVVLDGDTAYEVRARELTP